MCGLGLPHCGLSLDLCSRAFLGALLLQTILRTVPHAHFLVHAHIFVRPIVDAEHRPYHRYVWVHYNHRPNTTSREADTIRQETDIATYNTFKLCNVLHSFYFVCHDPHESHSPYLIQVIVERLVALRHGNILAQPRDLFGALEGGAHQTRFNASNAI